MSGRDEAQLGIKTHSSEEERAHRSELLDLLRNCPIPPEQLLSNLALFIESKNLSRILFMDYLYHLALEVQGCVMEFGTRWGQNAAIFSALRGIYEPFNRHRRIVAFDTFEGFPAVGTEDGRSEMMRRGNLAVTNGYSHFLTSVLEAHEKLNPLSHLRKFEIRSGDAVVEVPSYFKEHPETIVALAYFDFDLYAPTRACLEAIRPRLTRGSVLGFDELNDPDSPGETVALMETFGLSQVRLRRWAHASRVSYFVLE